jgi:hypothetical protein
MTEGGSLATQIVGGFGEVVVVHLQLLALDTD